MKKRFTRTVVLLGVGVCLWLTGCSGGSGEGAALQPIRKVDPFRLLERSEREVSLEDLLGRVWVAHLFFSSCSTECQDVTARLAALQAMVRPWTNVTFVSFTCDPGTDGPKELRTYAEQLGADPERWLFLTGERKPLFDTIRFNFLLPSAKNYQERAHLLAGPLHSDKLALVNPAGYVCGYFNALDDSATNALIHAIETLVNRPTESPEQP
ncbi:MAG: SCO family protein [Verrucomicrobiae bacterium]|nr:SCO family protein [Verrucomicrobiae bacterium]MCP5521974.1 SCO family protein [Verrucomicrobiales bacterium]